MLGGGERVGEAALRQTLELTAACALGRQRLTDSSMGGLVHGGSGFAPPPVRRPEHPQAEYIFVGVRDTRSYRLSKYGMRDDPFGQRSSHDIRFLQENCTMLQNEMAGVGFGGCLLHLLRLGSISSLSVVQVRQKQTVPIGRLLVWASIRNEWKEGKLAG